MVYIDVVVSTIDCITVYLLLFQRLCKLPKRCTRLPAASDNVYQLLAHGRWFCLGTLASSTTKTGRHDITEILLKVASLKHQKSIKSSTCFKDMSYIYYIILSFPLSVLYIIVCPFVLVILAIVLSLLLWFMASDYHFCIFKPVFNHHRQPHQPNIHI